MCVWPGNRNSVHLQTHSTSESFTENVLLVQLNAFSISIHTEYTLSFVRSSSLHPTFRFCLSAFNTSKSNKITKTQNKITFLSDLFIPKTYLFVQNVWIGIFESEFLCIAVRLLIATSLHSFFSTFAPSSSIWWGQHTSFSIPIFRVMI